MVTFSVNNHNSSSDTTRPLQNTSIDLFLNTIRHYSCLFEIIRKIILASLFNQEEYIAKNMSSEARPKKTQINDTRLEEALD